MNIQDYRKIQPRFSSNSIRLSTYIIYASFFGSYLAVATGDLFGALFMSFINGIHLFLACVLIMPDILYSMKIIGIALGVNKEYLVLAKVSGIYNDVKVSFYSEIHQLRDLRFGRLNVFPGDEVDGELKVDIKGQEFNVIGEVLYAVGFPRRYLERNDGINEYQAYQVAEIKAEDEIFLLADFDEEKSNDGYLMPANNGKITIILKSKLFTPLILTAIDLVMIALNVGIMGYAIIYN